MKGDWLGGAAINGWKTALEGDSRWIGSFYRVCGQMNDLIAVNLRLSDEPLLGQALPGVIQYTEVQTDERPLETAVIRRGSAIHPKKVAAPAQQRFTRPVMMGGDPIHPPATVSQLPAQASQHLLEAAAQQGRPITPLSANGEKQAQASAFPTGAAAGRNGASVPERGTESRRIFSSLQGVNTAAGRGGISVLERSETGRWLEMATGRVGRRLQRSRPVTPLKGNSGAESVEPKPAAHSSAYLPVNGPAAPIDLLRRLAWGRAARRENERTPLGAAVQHQAGTVSGGFSAKRAAVHPNEAAPTRTATEKREDTTPPLLATRAEATLAPLLTPSHIPEMIFPAAAQMQQDIQRDELILPEGDELNALSDKIKRILDDEARRHGIDV